MASIFAFISESESESEVKKVLGFDCVVEEDADFDKDLDIVETPQFCDDVIGVIFSYLELSECARVSRVSKQWSSVYRSPPVWHRFFDKLFPLARIEIPKKYKKKLNPDFYRIAFLYLTSSSSKWDEKTVRGKKLFFLDGPTNNRIVTTTKEDYQTNHSISTCDIVIPEEDEKKFKRLGIRKEVSHKFCELEIVETNPGNFAIGVVNEKFDYSKFSLVGFGNSPNKYDPNRKLTSQCSYGYSSNGFIRANGNEKAAPRIQKGDRITVVWNTCVPNEFQYFGHEFMFYRNSKLAGKVLEKNGIFTNWLRPTVTLYNASPGDCCTIRIVHEKFKTDFWGVLFPVILKDLGKKLIFRKKMF